MSVSINRGSRRVALVDENGHFTKLSVEESINYSRPMGPPVLGRALVSDAPTGSIHLEPVPLIKFLYA